MSSFIIQGGRRLSGRHRAPGNKNAVLPMLAACVLTDEEVSLRNVPMIEDVHTMLAILHELGVHIEQKGHSVTLCARGIRKRRLDGELCRKVRSSILFAGPMAARHGKVSVFPPGGDMIGLRPLDAHFNGLAQLGIEANGKNRFAFHRQSFKGSRILLEEASVTATENVLMAAVLAEGETTIFNAACEPHVQDLCIMLNGMGAQITNIGTNYLKITGMKKLHGVNHRVSPDYIDTMSFAAVALLTGGELQIDEPSGEHLDIITRPMTRLGARWNLSDGALQIPGNQRLKVQNIFGSAVPKIEDGVWPALPSDLMSVAIVMATQAKGTILFFEKMFESRMYFVDRLIGMGAKIVQCDPHRVVVTGRSRLAGIHMASPDIRAGMALLLAALCAKGESTIDNAQIIDRGYERIDTKLRELGADIVRVP